MVQYRALVIFASAALLLIVAAQQITPTAVQAYPAVLRGTAANRETKDKSVSFEAKADSETEQQHPGRVIPGQNTADLRGSVKRRLNEDTTVTLAIVFQTLIKAAYFAQGTPLWLVAFVAAAGGIAIGCLLTSNMMSGNLKIPPAWGPEMATSGQKTFREWVQDLAMGNGDRC
jgi:hypothetical protein